MARPTEENSGKKIEENRNNKRNVKIESIKLKIKQKIYIKKK